jgi:hypothetical protein
MPAGNNSTVTAKRRVGVSACRRVGYWLSAMRFANDETGWKRFAE